MSLNISEASAVNVLADHILPDARRTDAPDPERVRDALALLADRAHKPLMAGWTGDQVRHAWAQRPVSA